MDTKIKREMNPDTLKAHRALFWALLISILNCTCRLIVHSHGINVHSYTGVCPLKIIFLNSNETKAMVISLPWPRHLSEELTVMLITEIIKRVSANKTAFFQLHN